MTTSIEERLRSALQEAGAAAAAAVEVPDWDSVAVPMVTEEPGGGRPASPREPGERRRVSRRVAVAVLAAAAAVAVLLVAVPHDHDGLGVSTDGPAGDTNVATDQTVTGAPAPTTSPTVRSVPATTTHPPAPSQPPVTAATTTTEAPTTTVTEAPITTPSTVLDPRYRAALTPWQPSQWQPEVPADYYRPLLLPTVPPGQPCPVSTTYRTVDGFWPLLGEGPVTIEDMNKTAVFVYQGAVNDTKDYQNGPRNPYWGAYFFGLVSAPHTSAALIRGHQLDGDAPMGFESGDQSNVQAGLSPYDEDRAVSNSTNSDWELTQKATFRFKRPGCYGIQIDTASGSSVIILRAVGPVMVGG